MRVRQKLNGLRQFGNGLDDFWINVPDGVGQVVGSRLGLWQGQWYLNVPDGTPYATQVLGKYTGNTRDAAIRARILGTPGMSGTESAGIENYSSQLNRDTRRWTVNATLNTIFGAVDFRGII